MSIGISPESLSQQIIVGTILVGILGTYRTVLHHTTMCDTNAGGAQDNLVISLVFAVWGRRYFDAYAAILSFNCLFNSSMQTLKLMGCTLTARQNLRWDAGNTIR